jgi:hypothetical protein
MRRVAQIPLCSPFFKGGLVRQKFNPSLTKFDKEGKGRFFQRFEAGIICEVSQDSCRFTESKTVLQRKEKETHNG